MKDKENKVLDNATSKNLSELMNTEAFSLLDGKQKEKLINGFFPDIGKNGGWVGKILGNKAENVMLNIAFFVCLALFGLLFWDASRHDTINLELIDRAFPVITITLGYIFGKSSNK